VTVPDCFRASPETWERQPQVTSMRIPFILLFPLVVAEIVTAADSAKDFTESVRPILVQNCATCHNPSSRNNPANFLKATSAKDIEADRSLWRSLVAQLRNRTMPPVDSKLSEVDRLRVAQWVETRLRETACSAGEYAGAGTFRRLNRREYHNTIRDLLGVDLDATAIFPADGTGGAGFDTNGETLYIQPMQMERYMQAAQQALDRVIVTSPLSRTFVATDLRPVVAATGPRTLAPKQEVSAIVPVYIANDYEVRISMDAGAAGKLLLKIDGAEGPALVAVPQRGRGQGGAQQGGGQGLGRGGRGGAGSAVTASIRLERGTHVLALRADDAASVGIVSLTVNQKPTEPSSEKRALHYRLLGSEPDAVLLQPRKAAQHTLSTFLPKAFRRPVQPAEVDRYMQMYDRSAERGDPYEERIKLALKAVLVSSDFLFRIEQRQSKPGIYPLGQYELATRLSYFLWSTMPDEQLFNLAEQGRLQDPKVLTAQVDRMLDDPRSQSFTTSFIGQWLGTQEIGGRLMPLLQEVSSFYNTDIASDLRMQPILLLDRIIGEDRSILELLTADYMYLTQRLVKFYGVDDQVKGVDDSSFHLVTLPGAQRRAGVLGLAGILGMTSHYQQTSPVLRGAWVLDTILGTPVPPPPPGVPPLPEKGAVVAKQSTRERVLEHRANAVCATCHKLMDPIGFGLENFDWMGRWREQEDGKPIDASGEMPNGDKFNGPVELRQTLLAQKDTFVEQVAGKILGYALGRSLQDGDSCTVQAITDQTKNEGYRARTLIRQIVLSLPFRNVQGGDIKTLNIEARKLDITSVTGKSQDAKGH
jgi:mono/diheme cytochrome c family protein